MKSSNSPSLRSMTSRWILAAIAFCAFSTVSGFAPSDLSTTAVKSVLHATADESDSNCWTRRETLSKTASSLLVASAAAAGFSFPESSVAADATKQEIIAKLAGIPTFCLMNGPDAGPDFDGVPFGIYDASSATATGYFFMSYQTAQQALETASNLDMERGDGNIWSTAKIKVVPLSIAIQLSLGRRQRVAINEEEGVAGIKVNTVHNLIPSDDGNADAQRLDTSRNNYPKKWDQKGRVPLFSINEPSIKKDFYFLDTNSAIAGYKRNHPSDQALTFLPEIKVTELIEIFRRAQQSNDWESLRDFAETITPAPEARQDAIKLLTEDAKRKSAAYNFDKVYLVVSAKK